MNPLLILLIAVIPFLLPAYDLDTKNADLVILPFGGFRNGMDSLELIRRVNRCALYLDRNPDTKVLCCGKQSEGSSLSDAWRKKTMLQDRHIAAARIRLEEKSSSFAESFRYARDHVQPDQKILVCCSDYQALRAKLCARKNGYACKVISSSSSVLEIILNLPLEIFRIIRDLTH